MAIQDNNRDASLDNSSFPALIAHAGTTVNGETRKVTAQASGALDTHITGGTVNVDITGADVVSVSSGTQQTLGTVGVVNNLVTGTVAAVTSVANLVKGTITKIEGGTVDIDARGTPNHTRGTAGAAAWGTLVAAAGAGTSQFISNIDITVLSGTVDVAVTDIGIGGSTGDGVLARGQYVPSAGISKPFNPPIKSGGNGTLAFWMGGAGTVDIIATYWQGT